MAALRPALCLLLALAHVGLVWGLGSVLVMAEQSSAGMDNPAPIGAGAGDRDAPEVVLTAAHPSVSRVVFPALFEAVRGGDAAQPARQAPRCARLVRVHRGTPLFLDHCALLC